MAIKCSDCGGLLTIKDYMWRCKDCDRTGSYPVNRNKMKREDKATELVTHAMYEVKSAQQVAQEIIKLNNQWWINWVEKNSEVRFIQEGHAIFCSRLRGNTYILINQMVWEDIKSKREIPD